MNALRCLVFCGSASFLVACNLDASDAGDPLADNASELRRRQRPPAAPPAPAPSAFTLAVSAPAAGASVSGSVAVTGLAPGFVNLEIHSAAGDLLARVTPDGGGFSAPVDTTALANGGQDLTIDAWDSPAGTMYTNHASTSLTLDVENVTSAPDPEPQPQPSSCVDASGHGIRYFGAYTKNTQTNYDFDRWSGFRQDFLTSFINCDTWANAAASDWGFDLMSQQPPGENIQQVVCLSTQEDPSLQHVASGMYDEQIRNVGNLFLRRGYPNAIIRVGHEFEGFWYPWGLDTDANRGDFDGFIGAFRRVAGILKSVSPTFTIVWNPGCSWLAQATDSERGYPGDDVVDVVGVDCYDDNSGVDHLINGAYGMNQWAAFASAHDKPIALPEWGLMSGGDNPDYIQAMYDFMLRNNTFLESYWDSDDGSTQSQLSTGEAPNAGAKFLETFGQYARSCHP